MARVPETPTHPSSTPLHHPWAGSAASFTVARQAPSRALPMKGRPREGVPGQGSAWLHRRCCWAGLRLLQRQGLPCRSLRWGPSGGPVACWCPRTTAQVTSFPLPLPMPKAPGTLAKVKGSSASSKPISTGGRLIPQVCWGPEGSGAKHVTDRSSRTAHSASQAPSPRSPCSSPVCWAAERCLWSARAETKGVQGQGVPLTREAQQWGWGGPAVGPPAGAHSGPLSVCGARPPATHPRPRGQPAPVWLGEQRGGGGRALTVPASAGP